METCEKIKAERKRKGLTQKQLGDLIGIPDSTIRKYESGGMAPKLSTTVKFAKALKINPMELLPDWFIEEVNRYATP